MTSRREDRHDADRKRLIVPGCGAVILLSILATTPGYAVRICQTSKQACSIITYNSPIGSACQCFNDDGSTIGGMVFELPTEGEETWGYREVWQPNQQTYEYQRAPYQTFPYETNRNYDHQTGVYYEYPKTTSPSRIRGQITNRVQSETILRGRIGVANQFKFGRPAVFSARMIFHQRISLRMVLLRSHKRQLPLPWPLHIHL